jgi:hypothetical protein
VHRRPSPPMHYPVEWTGYASSSWMWTAASSALEA